MPSLSTDTAKRRAAEAALDEVHDGMIVGLGTGSTVAFLIAALATRAAAGLRITAVATSDASTVAARAAGIDVRDFGDVGRADLTIDGADEIDPRFFAIKGGGGAMLREKIVAAASTRMVVIADASKQVPAIGAAPLPVEILPFARRSAAHRLSALGAVPQLRGGDRPFVTDNGNHILDCRFDAFPDPLDLAAALDAIPGVLGHGLFLDEIDAAYISGSDNITRLERARKDR